VRWILLAALALAPACSDGQAKDDGRLYVVATTGMVADLARNVGGQHVRVEGLMGPGVDPHVYKASVRDLDRLKAADVVLYNGWNLEGRLGAVLEDLANRKPCVAIAAQLPEGELLKPPDMEGHYDPHVWFDTALWARTVPIVADTLAEADPDHKEDYLRNGQTYMQTLVALDAEVRRRLAAIPKQRRVLITSHDAFRYFGRAYDIEVRGLQGISTVQDAGVRDIQDMADLIVSRGIKAIFVESSVNPKAIKAVQEAVRSKGGDVKIGGTLFSDAMGDEPPTDTYVGMVRANVTRIAGALE